jgi:hypothetical protein
MFRSKHLVLAAAVGLISVSAMASNFRAADQVYVPAAGKLVTGSGTFVSDVWVQNLSNEPVSVSVIYTATSGGTQTPQYANNLFTLAARQRKELPDFVGSAPPNGLGLSAFFGTLIFNACRQGADCINGTDPATGINTNFRDIAVFSRIYSIPVGRTVTDTPAPPTNGQAFPGIPWYNYISSKAANAPDNRNLGRVFITGFRNTGTNQPGTYRSAVGLMNASQFSETTLQLDLFRGDNPDTPIATTTRTLAPLNHVQQNLSAMFPGFAGDLTPNANNLFVRVTQVASTPTGDAATFGCADGCPGFLAYGSLLDNVTNDATTLESIFEAPFSSLAIEVIYGGASAGKPVLRRSVKRAQ